MRPSAILPAFKGARVGRWSEPVDAIRSSWRLVHAVGVRPVAPPTAPPQADEETAAVEAAGSDVAKQPPDDPQARELWARDMAVRAEEASRAPDGSLPLLPTYDYQLGPDGLPYVLRSYARLDDVEADAPPQLDTVA